MVLFGDNWAADCSISVKFCMQASSFFNKNLTNADNDNSMNMSTNMEMSQVNKQRANYAIRQNKHTNTSR